MHLSMTSRQALIAGILLVLGTGFGCGDKANPTLPTAGSGAGVLGGGGAGIDGNPLGGGAGLDGAAGVAAGTGVAGTLATAGSGAGSGAAGTLATAGTGASGTGSAGTGAIVGPDPTAESLSGDGPYATTKLGAMGGLPSDATYTSAEVYYPTDGIEPYGLVAVIPGWTETVANSVSWWGPRLASHGFAVILIDTKTTNDCPDPRDKQLMAGLAILAGENTRAGSPLMGKLDTSKKAVMGHSMGGGASLIAAAAHSDLKAAIPMTPWSGAFAPCAGAVGPTTFNTITVPTLVIAGKGDAIAAENTHAHPFYMSIPAGTPKAYAEFNVGGHNVANNGNANMVLNTRYAVSWLKLYMDGDERYRTFIEGDEHDKDKSMFSRFEP